MEATRQTLLQRLRSPDASHAWEEFYTLYWQVILRYAAKLGLDAAAAQDVLQETMVTLIRILPDFKYDRAKGKFRNFVLTIVHRKVLAAKRRAYRWREVSADAVRDADDQPLMARLEADGPAPDEVAETRWRESIWEEALARVQRDPSVKANTFDVFRAYVIDGDSASEVARHFEVKENAVYQIRNRMLKRLERETQALLKELEDGGEA